MKRIISVLVLMAVVLGFAALPASSVKAETSALPVYDSSIQVQNLDAVNPATIYIYYYNPDGSLAALDAPYTNPVEDTIDAGSANTYLPIHAAAGFKGSAVVTSLSPIAIISNLTVNATNRALGTYVGSAGGGSELYFPLIDKRKIVSVFSIQNAGTGDAEITIDFIPDPNGTYADIADVTATIPEGAAVMYHMADYNGADQWLGSIKVTASTGSITGTASNVNSTTPASPTNAVYNGFNSGSNTVALPLVMEANSGNRTGTACMNLGSNPATITLSYSPADGYAPRDPDIFADIPANGIATKLFLDTGDKWVGSSIATISEGTLVCVVNQTRPTRRTSAIYEGFAPAAATDTVVLPLIMSKNGSTTKAFTNFSIASINGSNIDVTCDWKPAAGYADIADTNLSGAPTLVFVQQTGFSAGDTKWVGSAVCVENGGQPIVAVVNQGRELLPTGTLRDTLSAYDGFAQ